MSTLPVPVAPRLRRPSWRDTRLAVGVLLVAIGVLIGARAVGAADRTVTVCAASRTLVPGQVVGSDECRPVQVRLDDADRYLAGDAALAPGTVLLTRVGEGELVPRSALGRAEQVALRAVAVPQTGEARAWLAPGDVVDVWVTPKEEGARTPQRLLASLTVAAVPEEQDGGFGPRGQATSVQVLVPAEKVGEMIGSIDREDAITLVPVRQG